MEGEGELGKASSIELRMPAPPLYSARQYQQAMRAWASDVNDVWLRSSSLKRPLKLSMKVFCMGLPGTM